MFVLGKFTKAWNFGRPTHICEHCGAQVWYEERTIKSRKTKNPKFSICCSNGIVHLPLLKNPPALLAKLLNLNGGKKSFNFRVGIRMYNSLFAFTSLGGKVDKSVNNDTGPYVFRLNGQNYHRIGSLLPIEGEKPTFAQLYIYDTDNEIGHRIDAVVKKYKKNEVDPDIVVGLLEMLDNCNELVKAFRMARDRFTESEMRNVKTHLIGTRNSNGRQYNLPTSHEVAAVIVGDFNVESSNRDIIVENKLSGLQRISEVHPSFMSLQYPLLFPYGEDGFMKNISYRSNGEGKVRKRGAITMREYYAFRLQQRSHEGNTLLLKAFSTIHS